MKNKKDIKFVDKLARYFSKCFYKYINKISDKKFINSETSLYFLTFALLLMDLELKEEKKLSGNDNSYKNNSIKKFYDLVVILKNLNDGENFEISYLKDCFRFSNVFGFLNLNGTPSNNHYKKPFELYKNGKIKKYEYN